MSMTFEQVVETVKQFSPKQREILSDLMGKWEIKAVRHEIARDAQESLTMFSQGKLKPQSAQNAIKELPENERQPMSDTGIISIIKPVCLSHRIPPQLWKEERRACLRGNWKE